MDMIACEKFSFCYKGGEKNALNNLNLTIADGEFVGITGNSGAGKSTLTYALCGVIPHHFTGDFYGAVKINGMDTVEVSCPLCRGGISGYRQPDGLLGGGG